MSNSSTPTTPVITNVFVLMLENHSFDNILGYSGLTGVNGLGSPGNVNPDVVNTYNGNTYYTAATAPGSMPSDPGHEFQDTYQQLTGLTLNENTTPPQMPYTPPYPAIDNSGFVANYATSTTEVTTDAPAPPAIDYGDVMQCFDTVNQLPVIYQLASEFAVCNNWFSSIPGPTWPNRFFAYAASSAGFDDSPTTDQMANWETNPLSEGVCFNNGSIFDQLGSNYNLYQDNLSLTSFPIVQAINGIRHYDISDFSDFASDLQGTYSYPVTYIEPNYGDYSAGTYEGGSSQHPMDGMTNGEALIKATYEALYNSPLWPTSLLIITYDEHGGFFDHVAPPSCKAPDDGSYSNGTQGFDFKQLGVRVPAVIVSPYIAKNTVDNTVYDHSSILATVESVFNITALTERDGNANNLLSLLNAGTMRTDCPSTLNEPAILAVKPAATAEARAAAENAPLPKKGNLVGFLMIAMKTDAELSGNDPVAKKIISEKFKAIQTRGDAKRYIESVGVKVNAARMTKP